MNDLQVFDNPILAAGTNNQQLGVFGALAYNLMTALECDDEEDAEFSLDVVAQMASEMECPAFWPLYEAARLSIYRKFYKNEFYYQELFKNRAPKVLEGCKVIQFKTDGKNIPDAWLEKGGEKIPVEVKKYKFGDTAKKQLQRYMDAYGCVNGVAVGAELSTVLPDNVLFISLAELGETDD